MNERIAYLMVAALAIPAGPCTAASAPSATRLAGIVDILVGGVPQPRYAADGRWYVEALKGREYTIRLRNPYGVRVAVALSVDGLNTIDAAHTTAAAARKWVLDPHETVTISGWQTSRTEARRFEFTTEARSYGQALGKTANLGVITAVFFKERIHANMTGSVLSEPRRMAEAPVDAESLARQSPSAASPPAVADYAATGMGRRTDHAVTEVRLDLEDKPAEIVNIRYEFRPQLVQLGILPSNPIAHPLHRREGAKGFEPGFSPAPPHLR